MEALTTILLIVGLFIMWVAQTREKKRKNKIHQRPESIFSESVQEQQQNRDPQEDIRDRHLSGTLTETKESKITKNGSKKKIERLSRLKKAIVWSEILDKPVCERYTMF